MLTVSKDGFRFGFGLPTDCFCVDGEWHIDRHGRNEYVYNTEAHPFKVHRT